MKILFVHQGLQSFVKKDLDILLEVHEIRCVELKARSAGFLRGLLSLWKGVVWCDMTFSWFGKLHAFFAVLFLKILRKKSLVIAGGDDVARVPEIKYGIFCFWWKRWCPSFVFKYADLILPVSRFTEKETLVNARANPKKIKMIYHGFSSGLFKKITARKENLVITIGSINSDTRIRKGLKLFVEAARLLPNTKFLLIGPDSERIGEEFKSMSSNNITFLGGVCGWELVKICSRAKVYVQASVYESFGCSLAEAMLCECIPVVSRNGAIPEVVGDTGLYLNNLTPKELAQKVRCALAMPEDFGKLARNRIIEKFPLAKRREEILDAVRGLGGIK